MCVVLSLCSYKHVFNGLRRVAMEGNKQYVYSMTFDPDPDYVSKSGSGSGLGGEVAARGVACERGRLGSGRGSSCKGCGL